MTTELHEAIARLRRNQPRNPDTMLVCDAAEKTLTNGALATSAKFDRTGYQREYMRKRRAAERNGR